VVIADSEEEVIKLRGWKDDLEMKGFRVNLSKTKLMSVREMQFLVKMWAQYSDLTVNDGCVRHVIV